MSPEKASDYLNRGYISGKAGVAPLHRCRKEQEMSQETSDNAEQGSGLKPRVGLFVTCLVDLFRPSVGFAAVKLLEDAGCEIDVPSQTCCGQPAYNSGDPTTPKAIALPVV